MIVPVANFIGRKVESIEGKPTPACPQTGNDLVAPFAASCLATVQTGGTRVIKAANAARGVEITTVTAAPDNTVRCRASCSAKARASHSKPTTSA